MLHPEDFSLTKDVRHRKVNDLLDHQCLKPVNELKDDPDFPELIWLSHFRLSNAIKAFGKRNHVSTLRSTGVSLPKDGKTGRNLLTTWKVQKKRLKGSQKALDSLQEYFFYTNQQAE